jgi:glutamate dehydrogenase
LFILIDCEKNFNPYFAVGDCLFLDWLIVQIMQLQTGNRWQNQAREAYVDDIESQRQDLVSSLAIVGAHEDIETKVVIWQQRQELAIQRLQLLIGDLRQVATLEFSMIAVALKELRQLVRCSAENTEF